MSGSLASGHVKFYTHTMTSNLSAWSDLAERVQPYYDNGDPSHDLEHIRRVVRTCESIGRAMGANLDVLIPAAYLHDVVNVPKNSPERTGASRAAAEQARKILGALPNMPSEDELTRILQAIEEHSFSRGLAPSSLEAAILQDADRLDGLGAVGVMRTTTCGCKMGAVYYASQYPFGPFDERPLDDRRHTVDHFYAKLLKLEAGMNTDLAREEAKRRTAFMRMFLEQLRSEIPD